MLVHDCPVSDWDPDNKRCRSCGVTALQLADIARGPAVRSGDCDIMVVGPMAEGCGLMTIGFVPQGFGMMVDIGVACALRDALGRRIAEVMRE